MAVGRKLKASSPVFVAILGWLTAGIGIADTGDEFYEACDVGSDDAGSVGAVAPSFECFVSPAEAGRFDLVIDVTATPSGEVSHVPEALKMGFNDLLHKPWLRGKSALVLDEGLALVESARRCRRLQDAGLDRVKIMLGGLRPYLHDRDPLAADSLGKVPPEVVIGPIQRHRLRLLVLEDFREEGRPAFNVAAVSSQIHELTGVRGC